MSSSQSQHPVPGTPQVISPTPPGSSASQAGDEYFAPRTRSKTANQRAANNDKSLNGDRGRGSAQKQVTTMSTSTTETETIASPSNGSASHKAPPQFNGPSTSSKDLLSPSSASSSRLGSSYWRNLSRSPSPLGLIPIHRQWRDFIHKHEVPRKALHVSIGFITLYLYSRGTQISQIHPVLLSLLVPIFSTDVLRFRFPALNAVYIRVLGPFMRESEAHDRYNGVISYLAGLWVTMRFCHKDVAVMSVLLLSWSDTAASTIGRAYGRYTPRIRRGKSLAGSLAAFVVGVGSAVLFYEVVVPAYGRELVEGFAFRGELLLPEPVREVLGLGVKEARIEGPVAMGAFALVSGFVASFSEALDVFGLDDNLTIPILSSIGLGAFLWAFAS
jgi:diacylglycerol kinase (CTP)